MSARPFEDWSSKLSVKVELNPPSLKELASVISDGLRQNFAEVEVKIVPCPGSTRKTWDFVCPSHSDLRTEPFRMTAAGFGGILKIAEVGGQCNLFPHVQRHKEFNLEVAGRARYLN